VVLLGGAHNYRRKTGASTRLPSDAGELHRATVKVAVLLFIGVVAAWMIMSGILAQKWPWTMYGKEASQSDVLKLALGVVAAGGAAIALVVNYRRQQHLERDDAGHRDQVRLFTERFGAAAAQLGGERPAVRLAGVYSMAALADVWDTQQQQCIDVLCGYLRLPYAGEPPPGYPQIVVEQRQYADGAIQRTQTTTYQAGEIQVRRAIVDIIRQHLQPGADFNWSRRSFDFSGATLINADFAGAVFTGKRTSFNRATLSGENTSFDRATFSSEGALFDGATFASDRTSFRRATFSSKRTSFSQATFSSDRTLFDGATFASDRMSFSGATFSGVITSFSGASFSGRRTSFSGATFSGENTSFDGTTFANVDRALRRARVGDQSVDWGPVPPRSPWPRQQSAAI
jgi:hypothetical protein